MPVMGGIATIGIVTASTADPERRAVVDNRVMHAVQRRATSLMAAAPADPAVADKALAELRDFVVANLHHHHDSEDKLLWPMLSGADRRLEEGLAALSNEHDRLSTALDELADVRINVASGRDDLARAGATARDIVATHIEREETLILPALQAHMPDDEWDDLARQVVASAPPEAGSLMIGFLEQVATPAEIESSLEALPDQARQALPAVRKQVQATLDALNATETRPILHESDK